VLVYLDGGNVDWFSFHKIFVDDKCRCPQDSLEAVGYNNYVSEDNRKSTQFFLRRYFYIHIFTRKPRTFVGIFTIFFDIFGFFFRIFFVGFFFEDFLFEVFDDFLDIFWVIYLYYRFLSTFLSIFWHVRFFVIFGHFI